MTAPTRDAHGAVLDRRLAMNASEAGMLVDVHSAALDRLRKRAALAAWDQAVRWWRALGCPQWRSERALASAYSDPCRRWETAASQAFPFRNWPCWGPAGVAEGM